MEGLETANMTIISPRVTFHHNVDLQVSNLVEQIVIFPSLIFLDKMQDTAEQALIKCSSRAI